MLYNMKENFTDSQVTDLQAILNNGSDYVTPHVLKKHMDRMSPDLHQSVDKFLNNLTKIHLVSMCGTTLLKWYHEDELHTLLDQDKIVKSMLSTIYNADKLCSDNFAKYDKSTSWLSVDEEFLVLYRHGTFLFNTRNGVPVRTPNMDVILHLIHTNYMPVNDFDSPFFDDVELDVIAEALDMSIPLWTVDDIIAIKPTLSERLQQRITEWLFTTIELYKIKDTFMDKYVYSVKEDDIVTELVYTSIIHSNTLMSNQDEKQREIIARMTDDDLDKED